MSGGFAVVLPMLRRPLLRRIQLAFAGFALAEYGTWVAMLVFAYHHGGTTASGLIAVLQLVPAAFVAPAAARVTERRGGAAGLLAGYVGQAGSMGLVAAAILVHAPPAVAYGAGVLAACAVTVTRPAQSAVLAEIAQHPDELTGATVVSGWVESGSVLVGPAVAGALIAIDGPGLAFAAFAAGVAGSAALVARRSVHARAASDAPVERHDEQSSATTLSTPAIALAGVLGAEFVAIGALDVLVVVLAIGRLKLGSSGAGFLDAAFGAGGVIGAGAALGLVGVRTLLRPMAAAALVWAGAYALLAAFTTVPAAVGLLVLAGACRAVMDTAGRALLVRVTPTQWLGRTFGFLEGLAMGGLALGSLLVPACVALGGTSLALTVVAALLAVAVLAVWPLLRRADRAAPAADGMRRLHEHPLFARASAPLLETLARELVTLHAPAGATVVSEGDIGDRFYLVAGGSLQVTIVGDPIRTLRAGDGFGEIALLRDIPRTATVRAVDDAVLYGLDRAPFLAAMSDQGQL
jgi:Cyclic nucleotide-binding domain